LDKLAMRSSSRRQSPANSSMIRNMRDDRTSEREPRMIGNSVRKKRSPWRTATPRSSREARILIGDAGALADQPLPHSVQRLQVELVDGFRRDKSHRGTLHGLGNRFRVAEVILLSFRIGPHVLRRHQPSVVPNYLEPATG
jgi:hypothetical protein